MILLKTLVKYIQTFVLKFLHKPLMVFKVVRTLSAMLGSRISFRFADFYLRFFKEPVL